MRKFFLAMALALPLGACSGWVLDLTPKPAGYYSYKPGVWLPNPHGEPNWYTNRTYRFNDRYQWHWNNGQHRYGRH